MDEYCWAFAVLVMLVAAAAGSADDHGQDFVIEADEELMDCPKLELSSRSPAVETEPDGLLGEDFAETIAMYGGSLPTVTSLGMILLGNDRQRRAGQEAAEAMIVTAVATHLLKTVTGRPRPGNPDAEDGFPSGHASMAFSFARAISEEYEDLGKVAYVWASGVAWARVERRDHSLEQVLAGAALGWFIADRFADGPPRPSASARAPGPTMQLGCKTW